mmetsp:Transcript_52155/g.124266  ORF Transcript_52155/g.124266 Transcript_52155/m.124266 type:complete len:245 (+) Transcript_52155:410-1144(+)
MHELHTSLFSHSLLEEISLCDTDELHHDLYLQLETGLVHGVCQHRQNILQQGEVVLREEANVHLRGTTKQLVNELRQDLQAHVGHLRLLVLHRPYERVDIQLQSGLWQHEQALKAICIDSLQQLVELCSVIHVALEVTLNHVERALENLLEDTRHLQRNDVREPCGQGCQQVQDLCISCLRQVGSVVLQDWSKKRRHEGLRNLLHSSPHLLQGCAEWTSHIWRCSRDIKEGLYQSQGVSLHVPH